MLVISRRAGEQIQIGSVLTLTIASILPGRVRLSFQLPGRVDELSWRTGGAHLISATLHAGETLKINSVVICICHFMQVNQARIGITAPKDVIVRRLEVPDRNAAAIV